MAFIIPNATDVDGSKFVALDQAEPDSLDFQILGDRSTGVLTGCAVTATGSGTVAIEQGWVAVKGVVYQVAPKPSQSLPNPPESTNYRFDVVIARLTSGSIEIKVISGPSSTTNPTYPKSADRLATTTGVSRETYIDPTTDVVLAAIYRANAISVSSAYIVDKRVNVPSTTSLRGSSNPSSSIGSDGDLYYRTTESPSSSGVFIKRDGSWVELLLQSDSGAVTPIGAIIMWPSNETTPNPSGKLFWLECNGDAVPKSVYPDLYNLLKTTYGSETSTTFKLPDLNGRFVRGGATAGVTGGSNSTTLDSTHIPEHSHSLNNHTHSIGAHTHVLNVTKSITTGLSGTHSHAGDSSGNNNVVRLDTQQNDGWTTGKSTNPWSSLLAGNAGFGLSNTTAGMAVNNVERTSTAPDHNHSVQVVINDSTGAPTDSPTGTPTGTTTTGNYGSSTQAAVNTVPVNTTMRWFIRAI